MEINTLDQKIFIINQIFEIEIDDKDENSIFV